MVSFIMNIHNFPLWTLCCYCMYCLKTSNLGTNHGCKNAHAFNLFEFSSYIW